MRDLTLRADALEVGDIMAVDVINRLDPMYGSFYGAEITSVEVASVGYVLISYASDLVDHMGTPRGGGQCMRADLEVNITRR